MKTRFLMIVCLAMGTVLVRADVSYPIIEYRVLRPIAQVRLTAGFIHDPGLQAQVVAERAGFEQQGIVLLQVDSVRRVVRDEKLAGHSVKTELSLYPPAGRGYKGAMSTADIIITVDGKKRVDCPWDAGVIELSDLSVLPVDGFVSVRWKREGKSLQDLLFLSSGQTVTLDWLTTRGF